MCRSKSSKLIAGYPHRHLMTGSSPLPASSLAASACCLPSGAMSSASEKAACKWSMSPPADGAA
jgi:hypothetical protein